MFFKNLWYYIQNRSKPLENQVLFLKATEDHAVYLEKYKLKFERFMEELKDKPTYSIENIRGKYVVKKKRSSACVPIAAPKDNYTINGLKVLSPSAYETFKQRLDTDLKNPLWSSMVEMPPFDTIHSAEKFIKDEVSKMGAETVLYYNDAGERITHNA